MPSSSPAPIPAEGEADDRPVDAGERRTARGPRSARRAAYVASVALCVVLVGGASLWYATRTPAPAAISGENKQEAGRVFTVVPMRSVSRVTILGMIGAGKSVAVVSPFDGTVRERRAELGARVNTDDILVMMDGGEAESRFREAQSALLKASMALDVLNRWDNSADVMRARRTLESAEAALSTYERQAAETKALFDRGIVSRNEYDGLVQQRDTQRVGVASARQDLQTTMERGNENNRRLVELDVANAKARLSDLKQQVDGTIVRAPVAGILTRPPASGSATIQTPTVMDPGVRLTRGQPIFAIADTQTLIVTGKADESDVNQLRIAQSVTISSDAFPGDSITGRVIGVSAEADSGVGGTARAPSFEVRAAFTGRSDDHPQPIRLGMSARMTIETRNNPSAIVVPIEAVRGSSTAPIVRMRDPRTGKERDQAVVLGTTNESGVEIIKGLDIGVTIVLP